MFLKYTDYSQIQIDDQIIIAAREPQTFRVVEFENQDRWREYLANVTKLVKQTSARTLAEGNKGTHSLTSRIMESH